MILNKRLLLSLLLIMSVSVINAQKKPLLKIVNFSELQEVFKNGNDTTYVINFWATWCKPCIEELPAFDSLNRKYSHGKMKMILVSLDFPSNIEGGVIPFIKKHKLTPDIWLLDERNPNSWINKVSLSWSGAIPATIFVNKDNFFFS